MGHSHNHHCACKHENVKFCPTCKVVHCLDCNYEWVTKSVGNWYYPNYWVGYGNGTLTTTGYLQTQTNGLGKIAGSTAQAIPNTSVTYASTNCSHKG